LFLSTDIYIYIYIYILSGPDCIVINLFPAFNTSTGMAYGTVNLLYGVPNGETPVTCTAGIGTFIVEFGTLSRLTGDPIFEQTALQALNGLWKSRSSIGLVSLVCLYVSLPNSVYFHWLLVYFTNWLRLYR